MISIFLVYFKITNFLFLFILLFYDSVFIKSYVLHYYYFPRINGLILDSLFHTHIYFYIESIPLLSIIAYLLTRTIKNNLGISSYLLSSYHFPNQLGLVFTQEFITRVIHTLRFTPNFRNVLY